MKIVARLSTTLAILLLLLTSGCSSSGGSSTPDPPPVDNAPTISLVGSADIDVTIGEVYEDLGATADDDIDGDLTDNIVVGGDMVDTSVEGTYTITYNVSDSAGNDAREVTCTVTVSYWKRSTPEAQDMDSEILLPVMDYIEQGNLDIESLIVIRHGHIVLEEYPYYPDSSDPYDLVYDKHTMHIANSVTKSFVSALIGIAIQQGHIAGVEVKMTDLFPDRTIQNMDAWKEAITLEDILTMRVGMEWAEWGHPYTDCQNDYVNALWCQTDPIQYVLDLPMVEAPGTMWNYNGGSSHLLSALLSTFSDTNDTLDFAREFLFEPMGITELDWEYDSNGILRQGGSGLWLTPRDMAKFGYLYLNNGVWEGEQIVPATFVAESVKTHSYTFDDTSPGYGYQSWWTYPQEGVYFAAGANGQTIFVVPTLDLVVVLTAYLPDGTGEVQNDILFDYIIASCNS